MTATATPNRWPFGMTATGMNEAAKIVAPTTRLRSAPHLTANQRVMRSCPPTATRPDTANIAAIKRYWLRGMRIDACMGRAR
ncbi:Uncharacterised protein [Mycobacterium tuberculosis]|uniref:Uncharacterized protein n=1 Tax=Mycobacterium tuberculosis TaxID=1773 RepID=A0A655ABT0_MYCTX|nr:Uncharacterised protein [Mycobacterium tuberculosis]CKS82136.1 Uncharacterised protein [Mycobacterium tuberculosis]CKS88216.1 Uncharacterised protein [Mycobacterium tuberculosis]CNV39848.1 Uncharacterised protein [Mycobacterium tuberculosis]COY88577.1 Uncharacterised protein [Mycobacterium tuberculosis]